MKTYQRGTGGGVHVDVHLPWYEEQLYSLLKINIMGLPAEGDSDAIHGLKPEEELSETIYIIADNEVSSSYWFYLDLHYDYKDMLSEKRLYDNIPRQYYIFNIFVAP